MPCEPGDASCLHDHVYPHLRDPRRSDDGLSYRALATCHLDREHSLSVSVGKWKPVVWICHAGCSQKDTRDALVRDRISGRCLWRSAEDEADFEAAVSALVFGKESHPHKVLRLAAMIRGFGEALPAGADLRALAEGCGGSLREAYRLRGLDP
jgi:hypothetical protein